MAVLKKLFIVTGFLTLIASASISIAGTDTLRVDRRQAKQQNRIDQGIRSGSLTKREVNRLQNQQNRIERFESKAKADGVVTRNERARLTRKQNTASRAIYRKKNNRRY